MKFNEWVNNENYKTLERISKAIAYKYDVEHTDVLSGAIEVATTDNREIEHIGKYLNGYFFRICKGISCNILFKRSKIQNMPDDILRDISIADEVYIEEIDKNEIKLKERIEHLKGNNKLYTVINDRYFNNKDTETTCKEQNINFGAYHSRLKKAKKILKGEEDIKKKTGRIYKYKKTGNYYKGVACLNEEGSIEKVYESVRSVAIDGFDPKAVSALCNGKGNKKGLHGNFRWRFIEDMRKEQTEGTTK